MPPAPDDPDRRAEWEEARAVFTASALAWIMAPDGARVRGLSEVPVIAEVEPGADPPRRLVGVIDRLLIAPDRIDVVDYKTNQVEPDGVDALAAHYRPQLAAYRTSLQRIYPGREIRTWLIWTRLVAAGTTAGLTEVAP
jgi:ATP-dependent helicase/nuclease subunit A